MDFSFDYNSISEQFFKVKSELKENITSLKKLNIYEDYASFTCKKKFSVPLRKNASEEIPSKQDKLSISSQSEESESDTDQSSKKVRLQSAVIARVASSKTRKKFIHACSDNKVQLRNRRFLGMVQSTLRKFQDEEVRRQPQNLKRKKALDKVEAAAEEEKNSVKRQKTELLEKTRKQQLELQCLEKMMRISESFELWESNHKYLLNYIATETEPQIFFLPASLSITAKKQFERSRTKILEKIEKQKEFVKATLSTIRQSYDLSIPASTEETSLLSEDGNLQDSLELKIADEEAKDSGEILNLGLSENESEDFF